jgi:hypothetical protein
VLGLKPGATIQQINDAFHKLAMIEHPDKKIGDTETATANFQKINEAHKQLLKDAEDGLKTPPKAAPASASAPAPAPAQRSYGQLVKEKAQHSEFTKLFKTDRYNVLVYLYNYIQYIIEHFKIIQKDFKIKINGRYVDFWPIANKYNITDIDALPITDFQRTYKFKDRTITQLKYDYGSITQNELEELKGMVNHIDYYLQKKRDYNALPHDIKPKIEDNEELFYNIYLEQWKIKLLGFVKNNPRVNPNGYLDSVIREKCKRLNFESHTKMIANIEKKFLEDTEFQQWLDTIWSQNGAGPAAGGKRSINYKVQRTTRRPLRRKSATKRFRRRRSNRRSNRRTARK